MNTINIIKDKTAAVAKKAVMHIGENRSTYVGVIDICSNIAICVGWGKDKKKGYGYFTCMRRNIKYPIAATALTLAVNKCAHYHSLEVAKQNAGE